MKSDESFEGEWKRVQRETLKSIRLHMAEKDIETDEMLATAKVSAKTWSQYRRLQRPMKVRDLVAICMAVKLRTRFTLNPRLEDMYQPTSAITAEAWATAPTFQLAS